MTASVRDVINSRKNQFNYNHVFPKFDSTEPITVLTDSKWNRLMIEQLVSNAIKYSADTEKSKDIWFEINRQGSQIVLTVKDEGVGIPLCFLTIRLKTAIARTI